VEISVPMAMDPDVSRQIRIIIMSNY